MNRAVRMIMAGGALLAVAACDESGNFQLGGGAAATSDSTATRLGERDVEAPDVFQVSERGLWDGRPSLGGVWVAYTDVTDPERVIIRNEENGQFVIGALFRRERASSGPSLQVSSDAAEALGILAGAPTRLNVTALRREEVPENPAPAPVSSEAVSEASLEDTLAGAISEAEQNARPLGAEASQSSSPAPAAAVSSLSKPYIQVGIFSVEANAQGVANRLRGAGMVPTVLEQESRGRKFWRVIVGPTRTAAERAGLLQTTKGLGFADAYFVTN